MGWLSEILNITPKRYTVLLFSPLKPWSNRVASRRKFSTCVYLRLHLVRSCVHLRCLAMTCAHFGQDQICAQVDASFSLFGHPTQVNASWVMPIYLLSANEIQDMSALKWVFATFVYLRGNLQGHLATQRKSLCKFNLWLLTTTVLASPFDQSLRGNNCCYCQLFQLSTLKRTCCRLLRLSALRGTKTTLFLTPKRYSRSACPNYKGVPHLTVHTSFEHYSK